MHGVDDGSEVLLVAICLVVAALGATVVVQQLRDVWGMLQ